MSNQTRAPSATCSLYLNTSKDGDSITSLGSPVRCQITYSVKKCILMTNLNLPWCIFRLSSCHMPWEKSRTQPGSSLLPGLCRER